MSHFTVMVVGDDHEYELAPFQEFECTGINDEFVQNFDRFPELLNDFETGTERRYRDPDGDLHDPYEDRFYREFTPEETARLGRFPMGSGTNGDLSWHSKDWGDGKGYRAKAHFMPEGWTEVSVPRREVKEFTSWVEGWCGLKRLDGDAEPDLEGDHKHGWVRVRDGKVVEVIGRTNPDSKWDWYRVGGRWSDFFLLKSGSRADRASKGQIDFEAMRYEAEAEAASEWDEMAKARLKAGVTGLDWRSWQETRDAVADIEEAREAFRSQPAVKAMLETELGKGFFMRSVDEFRCEREVYIQKARDKAIVTYAFVKDRKWAQKGEMGWWGISLKEMDQADWNRWFNEQIDALPDDAVLTLVDCHI